MICVVHIATVLVLVGSAYGKVLSMLFSSASPWCNDESAKVRRRFDEGPASSRKEFASCDDTRSPTALHGCILEASDGGSNSCFKEAGAVKSRKADLDRLQHSTVSAQRVLVKQRAKFWPSA
eukprot:TRINITY_DN52606_c0_g1_i1.p1 TRINITY_DN52606_c0_g1~~TRINITY_DN52606_c0_g1_i1.p1  ORF type:complete len:122 (-),score=14.63 TRINITY_DN52606_c0_g1_i1:20-385(-)